jgi:ribosomal-protein-serine acetyltransferase
MKFDNYLIRQLSKDDTNQYFQLIENNRKRLEDFFVGTVSKTKTLKDTKMLVSEKLSQLKNKTYFPFVIVDINTQQIIGYMSVKSIDWNIFKGEFGYYIDEQYCGKGVTTKALLAMCNYFFNDLNFNKLFLRVHPNNLPSRKVAEKCGFEIEGTLRKDYKTSSGELVDLIYYGKLRNY